MTLLSPDVGQLADEEVRRLVRLMSKVAMREGGTAVQKRVLIEELSNWLRADYWMWNVSKITSTGVIVAVSLMHNLSDRQLALVAQENSSSPESPFNAAAKALCFEHGSWSGRLEDVLDRASAADRLYTRDPEIDMAESLFSFRQIPNDPGLFSAISLHRGHGSAPFSTRDLRIAHLLLSEVEWLHEDGAPKERSNACAGLAPRHQTVLTLLIDGQSTKQIAQNLELSEHTVRDYVKEIYRGFQVSSRAQLMKHFMVGTHIDRS